MVSVDGARALLGALASAMLTFIVFVFFRDPEDQVRAASADSLGVGGAE